MSMSKWIRQVHRWLAILFTLTVIANFVAMAQGTPPAVDHLFAAAAAVPADVHRPLHVLAPLCRGVEGQAEASMTDSETIDAKIAFPGRLARQGARQGPAS